MSSGESFITQYLAYSADTEPPIFFHRWAAIVGLGAYLGRQYYFQHGRFKVSPNIYSMLIGSAGTRKGTAIKMIKQLLEQTGYETFAAERTSKEKFLLDLAGETEALTPDQLLDQNIFGPDSAKTDCEMFVAIDEVNDFIGNGNIEFISMLGNMWDYNGLYKNRIKTGKSVEIYNPTISILGGNTPTGFSLAFPPETLGQGFFSRLLLVYADRPDRRITFPEAPPQEQTEQVIQTLRQIKSSCTGPATLEPTAKALLDKIYKSDYKIDDVRFEAYSNRRFTHLLKLCLLISASYCSTTITESVVIEAHTILTHTERLMPRALGEFGKAKNSDVTHKVVQLLHSTDKVLDIKTIWAEVYQDLSDIRELVGLMGNLEMADKVQKVPGTNGGFLPKRKAIELSDSSMYDPQFLTDEEKGATI
jgi:hypothetical protein